MIAASNQLPDRLLMGLGSPYRGDDAVGPIVVQEVAGRLARRGTQAGRVRVIEQGDPSELLHLFDGIDMAVLVDAVRTGRPAGTVVLLEGGTEARPPVGDVRHGTGFGGTHAFGLASVIGLARELDRLPRRLVVVGIEAVGFEVGSGLTPSVRASISNCADAVTELIVTDVVEVVGGAER